MPNKKTLASMFAVLTVICRFLTAVPAFAASKEQMLYSFCSLDNCTDGELPEAGMVFDADGNLYGTAPQGGAFGDGVVFELTPGTNGTWTETVLYSFCSLSGCADGAGPGSGLIFDASGNLYGTTVAGGTGSCASDCGAVFELTPNGDGTWAETVLHSFTGSPDGREPAAGVVFDAAGNLYGTTLFGGATYKKEGTAFELTPSTGGTWTETILHNFCSAPACADGGEPSAGLIFDAAGNLYGTTALGGSHQLHCKGEGCGVVFELTPGSNGKWKGRTLHSFNFSDGSDPRSSLIFDAAGNLYGTTILGGAYRNGTAFKLTLGKNGKWAEKILHSFGNGKDGAGPRAGLIFDATGNLYSTTEGGGLYSYGTVLELTPKNGTWTEKILHSFNKNGEDGSLPFASLIFDTAGNLYSTTSGGGASGDACSNYGCGTVFEITP